MYTAPTNSQEDRIAHALSEILNDNAPIGWEKYKYAARYLLEHWEIKDIVSEDGTLVSK
jgi:hypothetical protein